MITFKTNRGKYDLDYSEVIYFFTKDDKTFCQKLASVVEVDKRLYEIEEELSKYGFIRVSKWNIVNINMVRNAFRLFNSRIKLNLVNNISVYVNREYIKRFNLYLKGDGEGDA